MVKPVRISWLVGAVVLLCAAFVGVSLLKHQTNSEGRVQARPLPADVLPMAGPAVATKPPTNTLSPAPNPEPMTVARAPLPRPDQNWNEPIAEPAFASFANWANEYRAAGAAEKAALEAEGVRLASERRAALRELIQSDPARAMALAVPVGVRRSLPVSITRLLEERVSGRGSLAVFGALARPGRESEVTATFRKATVNGQEYDAFVYGWRLGEPSRSSIPLNGVAVDGLFAINEDPVRLLEPEETADRLPAPSDVVCAISGNPSTVNQNPIAADVGGTTYVLCGPSHALQLNQQIIQAEVAGDTGGGGAEVAASAATEGIKRLLLIRVDFSDNAGAPFADPTGISLIGGLNDFYMESSYGRSGFSAYGSGSDITPTFRMPQTAAYYGGNDAYVQLRTAARNAAAAGGYTLSNYDYDLICFDSVPGWGWAGLGYVGQPGAWLQGYFTVGVAGHELGHNYALNHANFWDTGGQSVIGAGSSIEYGDNLDTMGSANGGSYHFNARYKSYMNWLRSTETTNVTTSGVYRIYPHDDTNSTGLRGLKIVRSSSTNYWVEFRQKFTGNRWLMSGAGIRWAGNGNERSHLLDTTPGSPDGKNDAALVLGRTFSDKGAHVHITTLRKNGTVPESLDIAVNLGTFPGNVPPTATVNAGSTTTTVGSPVDFSAVASDANGDTLAYYWDFGDSTFGTNGDMASKSWTSSGQYVVRCTVSDMKGGVASDSVLVTVGNPGTYTISGTVTANGSPVEGVRMSVSSSKVTYTDSDGTYILAGLSGGSYTVSASRDGYTFSPFGFSNPVGVGPNAAGIDFSGSGGGGGGSGGTVNLTSPANNSTYTAPANIAFAATATASSGQIVTKVEFFQGSTKLGEDTTSPYTLSWNSVPAGSYTLTARSTDTAGLMATSAPVNITINPAAPAITSQPQNKNVTAGTNVTFSVGVSGSAPLSYQWRFNGTNLVGATTPTLALNNVQPQQAGGYSVVVTNAAGSVTSASATLTVTCAYTLSASSASFGAAGGSGSVNVATAGSCSWSIANVPAWVVITAGNGGTGNGTVSYDVATNATAGSRSATLAIGGRNYTVTQSGPDLTRPTVAFSTPAANATVSNAVVTITGTADDNEALASVECRVGAGAFAAATGTDTWSAQVTLDPGTNIISVRSIDVSGNISVTNTRSLFCAVPGALNLAINGQGSVSGATNGQMFPIGRVCKLTAVPLAGFAFSNWTGDVLGDAPALSFLMQSNLQITANFVTNPFIACKGSFNGLFYESNQVRLGSSGAFTLALTDKGTYTASLRIGNKRSKASGKLNLEGKATNVITRPGTNSLTITWAASLDGSDQITGTVSDGNWTATLVGDRAVFCRTNPASFAGKYTFLVLGSPGSTLSPEGDSYGTASVDSNGLVKVRGYLADKTSLAMRIPVARSGQWPLYAALYSGKGALLGWAAFTNQSATDFEGLMSWNKPAMPTAIFYPGGFSTEAALMGSRYAVPVGPTNRVLNLTNAVVLLSGGNLSQSFTNDVILGLSSKVTNASTHNLKLSFTLSSGLFRGSFTPTNETKAVSFKGAALQKANYGAGHFLGTNLSGRVSFEAGP